MADPLSIAASVVGVASAGIRLSTTLCHYTTTCMNADKTIKSIARDLSVTSSIITDLGNLLRCSSGESLDAALETICECNEVFGEIQTVLDGAVKWQDGEFKMRRTKRVIWPVVEGRLEALQGRLEKLKNTLVLVLNLLMYAKGIDKEESTSRGIHRVSKSQQHLDRLALMSAQTSRQQAFFESMSRRWDTTESLACPSLTSTLTLNTSCTTLGTMASGRQCFSISKENSIEYAKHLRNILDVVENPIYEDDGQQEQILDDRCQASYEALQVLFKGEKKKQPLFRRLWSRGLVQ